MRTSIIASALTIAALVLTNTMMAQAPAPPARAGSAPVQGHAVRPAAPDGGSVPPAAASNAPATRQAPVGHRQPRMQDLPPDIRKQEESLGAGAGR